MFCLLFRDQRVFGPCDANQLVGQYGVPQGIVLPTSKISFVEDSIACPNKPDTYPSLVPPGRNEGSYVGEIRIGLPSVYMVTEISQPIVFR